MARTAYTVASSPLLDSSASMISYEGNAYDIVSLTDDDCGFTFYYLSSREDLYKSYQYALFYVLLFYLGMSILAIIIFRQIIVCNDVTFNS